MLQKVIGMPVHLSCKKRILGLYLFWDMLENNFIFIFFNRVKSGDKRKALGEPWVVGFTNLS